MRGKLRCVSALYYNAATFMCWAISMDGKLLISFGKRIVEQKRCMNWICLHGGRNCKTERRLVIVTDSSAPISRAYLCIDSLRQKTNGSEERKKIRQGLRFQKQLATSL